MSSQPSVAKYKRALSQIWPEMSDGEQRMMLAHFRAPDRTLTTNQLAKAARYRSWRGVNLRYGGLGDRLCRAMGWSPPPHYPRASAIASFVRDDSPGAHTRWLMHQELAAAIENLKLQ